MDQEELFQREEKCQKAIRTVRKAVFMRFFVTVLLLWAAFGQHMELWATGLLLVVAMMNIFGTLPLVQEWKKQCNLLKDLIAQEE